jgi:pilus assembly protein TadC
MKGWRGLAVGLLVGGSVAVLVGGGAGAMAGLVVATAVVLVLRGVEDPHVRRERAQAIGDLPIAADLLAAVLRAGAPPERAATTVGDALGGPVGVRLSGVGQALRSGAAPSTAWRHVADLPGGERLARAAVRSAERGTVLTRVLDRQAEELRAARAAAAEAAARRVGVLVVLPLGLCFLPAFVLAGVVPVIVAVFSDVLRAH